MGDLKADQATLFNPSDGPVAAEKVVEVDIIGSIGSGFFTDGVTLDGVRATLRAAGKVDRIKTVVNSGGGSVFEGFAIFAELDMHPAPVSVEIRGLAASIASVIPMAAEPGQIKIHELGRVMVHKARAGLFGTDTEHGEMQALLADLEESLRSAYARHVNWTDDQLRAALAADPTWLKAEAAKEAGFVSEIVKGGDAVNYAGLEALEAFGVDVPAALRSKPGTNPEAAPSDLLDRITAHLRSHNRNSQRTPTVGPREIDMLRATLARMKETN